MKTYLYQFPLRKGGEFFSREKRIVLLQKNIDDSELLKAYNEDPTPQNIYHSTYEKYIAQILEKDAKDINASIQQITRCESHNCPYYPENEDFKARLFEMTVHPSQTVSTLVKNLIHEARKEFYERQKSREPIRNIREWADLKGKEIYLAVKGEITLEGAAIKSHARTAGISSEELNRRFNYKNQVSTTFPLTIDEVNNTADYKRRSNQLNEEDSARLRREIFEEKAREMNGNLIGFIQKHPNGDAIYDEKIEAFATMKTILMWGGESFAYQWKDFDGAKRPSGIMYTVFAELIKFDTEHGGHIERKEHISRSVFSDTERKEASGIFHYFDTIDTGIYMQSRFLEENAGDFGENSIYAEQLRQLKEERSEIMKRMITFREDMIQRREKQGKNKVLMESTRIRFMPRLDPQFIAVLKKRRDNSGNILSLDPEERKQYYTVRHIAEQIFDINTMSPGSVAQIMIAQATGAEDIIVLEEFLEEIRQYAIKEGKITEDKNPFEDTSLCPLFETESTVSPEAIQGVLSDLWRYYVETPGNGGQEKFEKRIVELFFAGSDLSKGMGQASAFLAVWNVAQEIFIFSKIKGVDIRIKLGSGEAFFRQLGFLDPRAYDSVVRERVENDEFIESKELRGILKELYGEDWKKVLVREPSGLHALLKKFPWINSVTTQSKSREWMIDMNSSQLLRLLSEMHEQKDVNIKKLNELSELSGSDEEKRSQIQKFLEERGITPPPVYVAFAKAEKETYQSLMGKEGDHLKVDGLRSLPALIEVFATQLNIALRDRPLARDGGKDDDPAGKLLKLLNGGVDARCIAANTASNMIFPLGLLGKGKGFQTAMEQHPDDLETLLDTLHVEDFLQEIRQYDQIADTIFSIMDQAQFDPLAVKLRKEWKKIKKIGAVLAKKLYEKTLEREIIDWEQLEYSNFTDYCERKHNEGIEIVLEPDRDLQENKLTERDLWNTAYDELPIKYVSIPEENKEKILKALKPRTRSLLDYQVNEEGEVEWEGFESKNLIAYKDTFKQYGAGVLRSACKMLHEAQEHIEKAIGDIVQEFTKEQQGAEVFGGVAHSKEYSIEDIIEAKSLEEVQAMMRKKLEKLDVTSVSFKDDQNSQDASKTALTMMVRLRGILG